MFFSSDPAPPPPPPAYPECTSRILDPGLPAGENSRTHLYREILQEHPYGDLSPCEASSLPQSPAEDWWDLSRLKEKPKKTKKQQQQQDGEDGEDLPATSQRRESIQKLFRRRDPPRYFVPAMLREAKNAIHACLHGQPLRDEDLGDVVDHLIVLPTGTKGCARHPTYRGTDYSTHFLLLGCGEGKTQFMNDYIRRPIQALVPEAFFIAISPIRSVARALESRYRLTEDPNSCVVYLDLMKQGLSAAEQGKRILGAQMLVVSGEMLHHYMPVIRERRQRSHEHCYLIFEEGSSVLSRMPDSTFDGKRLEFFTDLMELVKGARQVWIPDATVTLPVLLFMTLCRPNSLFYGYIRPKVSVHTKFAVYSGPSEPFLFVFLSDLVYYKRHGGRFPDTVEVDSPAECGLSTGELIELLHTELEEEEEEHLRALEEAEQRQGAEPTAPEPEEQEEPVDDIDALTAWMRQQPEEDAVHQDETTAPPMMPPQLLHEETTVPSSSSSSSPPPPPARSLIRRGYAYSNSINMSYTLYGIARRAGFAKEELLLVNRETRKCGLVAEFLRHPNGGTFLDEHAIRLVIFSPTVQSAVSVDAVEVDMVWGHFITGSAGTADSIQQQARFRHQRNLRLCINTTDMDRETARDHLQGPAQQERCTQRAREARLAQAENALCDAEWAVDVRNERDESRQVAMHLLGVDDNDTTTPTVEERQQGADLERLMDGWPVSFDQESDLCLAFHRMGRVPVEDGGSATVDDSVAGDRSAAMFVAARVGPCTNNLLTVLPYQRLSLKLTPAHPTYSLVLSWLAQMHKSDQVFASANLIAHYHREGYVEATPAHELITPELCKEVRLTRRQDRDRRILHAALRTAAAAPVDKKRYMELLLQQKSLERPTTDEEEAQILLYTITTRWCLGARGRCLPDILRNARLGERQLVYYFDKNEYHWHAVQDWLIATRTDSRDLVLSSIRHVAVLEGPPPPTTAAQPPPPPKASTSTAPPPPPPPPAPKRLHTFEQGVMHEFNRGSRMRGVDDAGANDRLTLWTVLRIVVTQCCKMSLDHLTTHWKILFDTTTGDCTLKDMLATHAEEPETPEERAARGESTAEATTLLQADSEGTRVRLDPLVQYVRHLRRHRAQVTYGELHSLGRMLANGSSTLPAKLLLGEDEEFGPAGGDDARYIVPLDTEGKIPTESSSSVAPFTGDDAISEADIRAEAIYSLLHGVMHFLGMTMRMSKRSTDVSSGSRVYYACPTSDTVTTVLEAFHVSCARLATAVQEFRDDGPAVAVARGLGEASFKNRLAQVSALRGNLAAMIAVQKFLHDTGHSAKERRKRVPILGPHLWLGDGEVPPEPDVVPTSIFGLSCHGEADLYNTEEDFSTKLACVYDATVALCHEACELVRSVLDGLAKRPPLTARKRARQGD